LYVELSEAFCEVVGDGFDRDDGRFGDVAVGPVGSSHLGDPSFGGG
jgi:hypothetical protein